MHTMTVRVNISGRADSLGIWRMLSLVRAEVNSQLRDWHVHDMGPVANMPLYAIEFRGESLNG
jgi:hypothetical protein